jgi:hypothetical protein
MLNSVAVTIRKQVLLRLAVQVAMWLKEWSGWWQLQQYSKSGGCEAEHRVI